MWKLNSAKSCHGVVMDVRFLDISFPHEQTASNLIFVFGFHFYFPISKCLYFRILCTRSGCRQVLLRLPQNVVPLSDILLVLSDCFFFFFFFFLDCWLLHYIGRLMQKSAIANVQLADAQTDLGLRCPHMPEDTFSYCVKYLYIHFNGNGFSNFHLFRISKELLLRNILQK